MNSYTVALINQIAMMFVIIALGYILKKVKFFSDEFVFVFHVLVENVVGAVALVLT